MHLSQSIESTTGLSGVSETVSRISAMIRSRGPALMRAGGGALSRDYGSPMKIDAATRARIVALGAAGRSPREIAAEIGCAKVTAAKILRTARQRETHGL